MGGFGSTRWLWSMTKQTTDDLLVLDVRFLARHGYFAAGPGELAAGVVTWTWRGHVSGLINVEHRGGDPDAVTLDYRVRRPGEDWRLVRERIALDRTACNFGGSRLWFRCPSCAARRAVLYGAAGRFRCRICHDLAYDSTREDAIERHRRRADTLRRRLGGRPGPFAAVWKPKGMHGQTYHRIVTEIRAREVAALVAVRAETDTMLARLPRHDGSLPAT